MDPERRAGAGAVLVPGLACLAFAVLALLYGVDRPLYRAILDAIHVHPFPRPFLDTRFVTAQVECWRQGIDVYVRNPCDPLGRTLDYSPLWLHLPFLARSDRWTPVLGLATDLLFLLALFRMPWRIGGGFDAVVAIGSVLSWATIYANERGNTDLLIFAAAVLASRLLVRSWRARVAAYAVVLVAALLKFYPATLLALALRERAGRFRAVAAGSAAVLLAFVVACAGGLARIGRNMANGLYGDMFGARSVPFGFATRFGLARPWDPALQARTYDPAAAHPTLANVLVLAAFACAAAAAAWRLGRGGAFRAGLAGLEPVTRSLLLVGAVLVGGCFLAHQNIGYRAVLLLLALPGLLALGRDAPSPGLRGLFRATSVLVVLALSGGIAGRSAPGWLAMQMGWWAIVTVLGAMAFASLGDDLRRQLRLGRRLRRTGRGGRG